MPTYSLIAFILCSVLLASQTCSLLSDISLGETYSYILNISSVLFPFSSPCIPIVCTYFIVVPQAICFYYYPLFTFFPVLEVSIETSLNSEFLSFTVISLLISILRTFFSFITVFLVSSIYFGSVVECSSLCLHCYFLLYAVYFIVQSSQSINNCCLKFTPQFQHLCHVWFRCLHCLFKLWFWDSDILCNIFLENQT